MIFLINLIGVVCLLLLADEAISVKIKRRLLAISFVCFAAIIVYMQAYALFDKAGLRARLKANEYGANTTSQFY